MFFKEHVLGGADFTPRAQTMPGTAAVVNAVSKEKFGDRLRRRRLRQGDQDPQGEEGRDQRRHQPREDDVQDGSYPLARPLFFYLRAKATGDMKAFIDWVLSPDGQGIVDEGRLLPGQVARAMSGARLGAMPRPAHRDLARRSVRDRPGDRRARAGRAARR